MVVSARQFQTHLPIPTRLPHTLHALILDVEFLLRKVSRQHKYGSLDDPIEFEYNTEPRVQNENELRLGRDLMGEGALQQAVALLPYIPNIFIKLGSLGVLGVRLCPKETEITDTDATTLRFPGVYADVVVQHHRGLPHRGVVSVTGAGLSSHLRIWLILVTHSLAC